jgi:hypothetical protein
VPAAVNSIVRLDETGKFIEQTIQGTGQLNTESADILMVGGSVGSATKSCGIRQEEQLLLHYRFFLSVKKMVRCAFILSLLLNSA